MEGDGKGWVGCVGNGMERVKSSVVIFTVHRSFITNHYGISLR